MRLRVVKAWSSQSGAELVEFALVLPVFLLVTAGIVDFGFVFQQYNVVTNAAREGARLAVVPNTTDVAIDRRVKAYVKAGGLVGEPTTSITSVQIPTHPGGPRYTGVKVTVTYPCRFLMLSPITSMLGRGVAPPTLRAEVAMRNESQ
jgi:Flp pilus assembly protein TadG